MQERLGAGQPVELPQYSQNEPPVAEGRREIPAAWIVALVEQPKGTVAQPVVIRNATIVGDLKLRYVEFQADVCFTGCRFKGEVDFSFCVFSKAAVLDGSHFEKKVSLRGTSTRADFEWTGTEFDLDLEGPGLAVARSLYAQGAKFGSCNLQGASVVGHAVFKQAKYQPAHFRGEARFDLVQIGGGLLLSETIFDADVSFVGATVKHFADFSSVVFSGKVKMDGLVIDGDAFFDNAQFLIRSCDPKEDRVRFPGIRIAGQGVFDRAVFGGEVRFDQACFMAEAFFESAQFHGNARFDGASFAGVTRFTRDEDNDTRAAGDPTRFLADVNFAGAKAFADIHFEEAQFSRDTSFRDASFKIVYFRESVAQKVLAGQTPQFGAPGAVPKLDLRGFSYDRIFVAWGEALGILEPYDVQPYRQMERALRTIGKDRDADKVYLKQRRRALWYDCRHPRRWLLAAGGLLYWAFARFGARPLRLAVIPLILVFSSAFVFSLPHAVRPRKDSGCVEHNLTLREASGVSLNYFLPVEVPVGACWQATDGTFPLEPFGVSVSFLFWATVVKLCGWIFVPLAVAALGGFFRRDPSK